MKILLTNESLAPRAGEEALVRDMARGLQARGHLVMAYSSDPRQGIRLLERDLIAVATDLENLPIRPDIIHAMHPWDAITALTSLPGVPAVYHDHGHEWEVGRLWHPRIHHTLVASRWLVADMGRASEACSFFPTPMDAARFRRVRSLPPAPGRALFINRHLPEQGDQMAVLQKAAARCGLQLHIGGRDFGVGSQCSEGVLPEYDLVFASGQVAMEGIACGCAVVVVGRHGFGGMVTVENLSEWRERGFLVPSDGKVIPFNALESVLSSYAPESGPMLAEAIHRQPAFDEAIDHLLEIYKQVLLRQEVAAADPVAESRAISRYLNSVSRGIGRAHGLIDGQWRLAAPGKPFSRPIGANPQT